MRASAHAANWVPMGSASVGAAASGSTSEGGTPRRDESCSSSPVFDLTVWLG